MLTVSFRMRGKKIAACLLAGVIVLGAGWGVKSFFFDDTATVSAASDQKQKEKVQKAGVGKTEEDRAEFLASFGWEISEEPLEVREVIIPKDFDNVYAEYNELQKATGYDLTKYSGKRCKRYSYIVTNYPGNEKDVQANILVYKDKIIGGDVSSAKLDGFMHGFKNGDITQK